MAGRIARVFCAAALAATAGACSDATGGNGQPIVFGPEGNNLNAYSTGAEVVKQTVIANHDSDPNGRDINGQVCFAPDVPEAKRALVEIHLAYLTFDYLFLLVYCFG